VTFTAHNKSTLSANRCKVGIIKNEEFFNRTALWAGIGGMNGSAGIDWSASASGLPARLLALGQMWAVTTAPTAQPAGGAGPMGLTNISPCTRPSLQVLCSGLSILREPI
jgi:hypothetical protein